MAQHGFRFVVAGGVVAVVYLVATTTLAHLVGLRFQLALAIGFAAAVATHFSLHRLFVWTQDGAFVLPLRRQMKRYAILVGIQYGSTVLVTAKLPRALDASPTAVYFAWTVAMSVGSFFIFGRGVFHTSSDVSGPR